ncbi:MAG: nucleotidyltransferase, partial [Gemmatimonadales bacterium]|nr:nucleotidyltransferase [Gemmatimonadales bacterium]
MLPPHVTRRGSVALIGSVARGDDTDTSDYDFVVEFLPGASLFDHAALESAL